MNDETDPATPIVAAVQTESHRWPDGPAVTRWAEQSTEETPMDEVPGLTRQLRVLASLIDDDVCYVADEGDLLRAAADRLDAEETP